MTIWKKCKKNSKPRMDSQIVVISDGDPSIYNSYFYRNKDAWALDEKYWCYEWELRKEVEQVVV